MALCTLFFFSPLLRLGCRKSEEKRRKRIEAKQPEIEEYFRLKRIKACARANKIIMQVFNLNIFIVLEYDEEEGERGKEISVKDISEFSCWNVLPFSFLLRLFSPFSFKHVLYLLRRGQKKAKKELVELKDFQ